MTAPAAAAPAAPARWTRYYWPAAVYVVAAAWAAGYAHPGLLPWIAKGGTAALAGPEVYFLARRQWASTLSEWVWRVLHVISGTRISRWTAEHFLAAGAYAAYAADVLGWLWPRVTPLAAHLAVAFALWLFWHLFLRWWR